MSAEKFIVHMLVASPAMRDMIRSAMASVDVTPVALHSPGEYLRQPESGLPGCLLLEMDLPDTSGVGLQARIVGTGAAIVFVSDRADIAQSVRAMKAGAVDYLTAPIDSSDLIPAVRRAIELDSRRKTARARLAELARRYRALTARERELFPLLTSGLLNKQVASAMAISPMTVQIHRGRIMRKMNARTFAELVRFADALGIGTGHGEGVDDQRATTARDTSCATSLTSDRNQLWAGS